MNNSIQWRHPFIDQYGDGMVHRPFLSGNTLYTVGFERIMTPADLMSKGIDLQYACPAFQFPAAGTWAIIFDSLDPDTQQLRGYQHVRQAGLINGRVLIKVASIIYEHYIFSHAGCYVFTAATDPEHTRQTDLAVLYARALGVAGYPKSTLFAQFEGWEAWSDFAKGGRGYVITTQQYSVR